MLLRIAALVAAVHAAVAAPAPAVASLQQYLPPLPGYIPVYIRPGDTPLEDINQELAEAFRSYAIKHNLIVPQGRARNVLDAKRHGSKGLDDFDLDEPPTKTTSTKKPGKAPQHIQRIRPRT